MTTCLIVQPIHQAGCELLEKAGVVTQVASAYDDSTVGREIIDVDAVITRSAGLRSKVMDEAPHLRAIVSHGVGVDLIDVRHATKLGIPVANTPGANSSSVAEHAIALMLATVKSLPSADRAARHGDFDFKYQHRLTDISGKTLGVIGFGAVGRRVAHTAKAGFGMRVLVHSATANADELRRLGYELVPALDILMREADIVSLHRIANDATRGMIGARELSLMKRTAIFVNTARGTLVDEKALTDALFEGRIAGAGLDVFASENMPSDHPLLSAPNAVLSPHISGSTEDALHDTAVAAAEHVLALLSGRMLDVVNPSCWSGRRYGPATIKKIRT